MIQYKRISPNILHLRACHSGICSTYMRQNAFGYKWEKRNQTGLSISEGSEIFPSVEAQISLSASWMREEDTRLLGQRHWTFVLTAVTVAWAFQPRIPQCNVKGARWYLRTQWVIL